MAQKITLTKAAVVGGAGLLAYQFLYKPWRAAQDAAGAPAPVPLWSTGGGGGTGGGGFPYIAPSGGTASNLNPGAAVGGPVGACMSKKGWTQQQCTARLTALVSAWQGATAQLAAIQGGAGATAAAAEKAAQQQAYNNAGMHYANAVAAGNTAAAQQIKAEMDQRLAYIQDIDARVAQLASTAAALTNAIAGHKADYLALTGYQIG